MDDFSKYYDQLISLGLSYGPKLILALITFFIGLRLINILSKLVKKSLARRNIDPSLSGFLISFIGIGSKVLLCISVVSMVGVEMTSVIALLGGAGIAVGMALSGTLQNFAGGIVILVLRPFKVDDFIEAQGFSGTVKEIQIFHTILTTVDNKTVIIPNSPLSSNALINYSAQETRRVDLLFSIGYQDDIDKAKRIIQELVDNDSRVQKDPEKLIVVSELGDSSVNITTRVWVASEDYWDLRFYLIEAVKKRFDKEGISIPYPQRDIHLHQVNS